MSSTLRPGTWWPASSSSCPTPYRQASTLDLNRLPALTLADKDDSITVKGERFQAVFSRSAGTLSSLAYNGVEVLSEGRGPRLNLFRAMADNDKWMIRDVECAGIRSLTYSTKNVAAEQLAAGIVRVRCTVDCAGSFRQRYEPYSHVHRLRRRLD